MQLARWDRWHGPILGCGMVGITLLFAVIVGDIIWRGLGSWHSTFLTSGPEDGGRSGGILPIIVSTSWILGICLLATLPLGLGCALYLHLHEQQGGVIHRTLRHGLDLMAAIPSIVYGLVGAALFCDFFNFGYSILSGGLTLACMVLPLFVRLSEQVLQAMPRSWHLTAVALGLSQWRLLLYVCLPRIAPQLLAVLVLCLGRALAETAALLFTSGYVTRMPDTPLDSGRSISVHIYELAMNLPGGDGMAAASAMLLFMILAGMTLFAQAITHFFNKGIPHE